MGLVDERFDRIIVKYRAMREVGVHVIVLWIFGFTIFLLSAFVTCALWPLGVLKYLSGGHDE